MLGEFLSRLAIALPLVCAAAVVTLLAVKRGWIRLPGFLLSRPRAPSLSGTGADLAVTAVRTLTPTSRVAIIRFHGRDHLIGLAGNALVLLATADATGPPNPSTTNPENLLRREPTP